jgi:hypothetical protein
VVLIEKHAEMEVETEGLMTATTRTKGRNDGRHDNQQDVGMGKGQWITACTGQGEGELDNNKEEERLSLTKEEGLNAKCPPSMDSDLPNRDNSIVPSLDVYLADYNKDIDINDG